MSIDDLNREQKRQLRRQGALTAEGTPTRAPRQQPQYDRAGPGQYLSEVRDELRKVAWPTRPEIIRYSIIVSTTVVIYTSFVGGMDYGLQFVADWFYA
jgi:preprotein translocase subunit SecE